MKRIFLVIIIGALMLVTVSCSGNKTQELAGLLSGEKDDTDGSNMEIIVPELDNGRAVLFKLPTEEYILADCGTTKDFPKLFELLRNNNVEFIDHIILTSDSEVCIGGLDKILANFSVGEIHISDQVKDKEVYLSLCKMAAGEDAWLRLECEGSRIYDFESVCFDVVSSFNCVNSGGKHCVMSVYVTYRERAFLLEGDGDYWSETEMVATMPYDIRADVLFVANCGSNETSNSSFLQAVCPEDAVIPVYGNKTVSDVVLKSMKICDIDVWRTDFSGNITVISDGKQYSIKKER